MLKLVLASTTNRIIATILIITTTIPITKSSSVELAGCMGFRRFIVFGLFLIAALLVEAAGSSSSVTLADVPAVVQKTINTRITGGTLGEIDRTIDGVETTFDVSFTNKAGEEHDFVVADDGTLISVEVAMGETPAAVQQIIRAEATGWELESIDKNLDDTEISYDVAASKDGNKRNFTVAADGTLLSLRLALTNVPVPVQATIKTLTADGALQSLYEDFDPEGNTFDVAVIGKDGVKKSFSLAMDGRMLSRQVTLEEVSPKARKTIETRLAGGRILQIDKSLMEKQAGVLPYRVQGRKDGKPFDFSVGPRGKFLGMDD